MGEILLDINLLRTDPKVIEASLKKRNDKEKIKWLKDLVKKDEEYRARLQQAQALRTRRNQATKEIDALRQQKKDFKAKIREAKELPAKIKATEDKANALKAEVDAYLLRLPNLLHESVPQGKDDADNKVVKEFGKKPKFNFKPKNHIELAEALGLLDLKRAAKISQARFYFLKGELALLDLALMKYAADFLAKKGFVFHQVPEMMNRQAYEGVVDLADFEDVMYKVENEDLYLIATSEHPLVAQHQNEVLEASELPLKYSAFSVNFRKEVGAHGIQDKGLWRVHQFNKVEQVVICQPEQSWQLHEALIKNAEEFLSSLELPFRKVNVCTGDIGTVAAKKYDLEQWIPSAKKYKEVVSCSNCTDYQANRLKLRYRTAEGNRAVHTLNSTCIASRALVAILENFQQADGSVKLPKALWPYTGFKALK